MNLKVINELRDEVKQFKSVEEFDLYYQKNKDAMNSCTTQYLNKVYKINGSDGTEYRITKKNCTKQDGKLVGGDIYLKKVVSKNDTENNINELMYANVQADITNLRAELDKTKNQLNELTSKMESIIEAIPAIKNTLNEVVRVINSTQ